MHTTPLSIATANSCDFEPLVTLELSSGTTGTSGYLTVREAEYLIQALTTSVAAIKARQIAAAKQGPTHDGHPPTWPGYIDQGGA